MSTSSNQSQLLRTITIMIVIVLCAIAGYVYIQDVQAPATSPVATGSTSTSPVTLTTKPASTTLTAAFPAKFISSENWPPSVEALGIPSDTPCVTSSSTLTAPATTKVTIASSTYCKTTTSEGAAGSTYVTYSYRTEVPPSEAVNFNLRYPNCDNYPEPEQTTCITERESFNLDTLVHNLFTAADQAPQ